MRAKPSETLCYRWSSVFFILEENERSCNPHYIIAFEVVWNDPSEPCPNDAEEAVSTYIDSKLYLWFERYLHSEFDINRERILNSINFETTRGYQRKAGQLDKVRSEI